MRMINADAEELWNLSIIRAGEPIVVMDWNGCGIKCLRVQGSWAHGVRSCPWDEKSLFIPILSKETGDIVGDGKTKTSLGDRESYSKEGLKE